MVASDARSTGRASSTGMLLVAWGATLLLSRLPEIVLREVVGWDVPWINIVWIVVAAGFIVAASVVPLMRPLRDYFVVMLTVLVLTTVVDPLIRAALFGDIAPAGTDPQLRRLFAERVLLVLEALAIIPVLAALGYRGGEAYLALGKLRAPTGLRIGRRALSWAVVGPIVAVLLVAATAAFASSLAQANRRYCGRGHCRCFRSPCWRRHATRSQRRFYIGRGRSDRWPELSGRGPVSGSSRPGSVSATSTGASHQE